METQFKKIIKHNDVIAPFYQLITKLWHGLCKHHFNLNSPCRVGLMVSVSASHTIGRGFASRPGHTKDHHKNGTNCLPARHAMRYGRSLTVHPDCLKGWVVCGTVYGDMHLKISWDQS